MLYVCVGNLLKKEGCVLWSLLLLHTRESVIDVYIHSMIHISSVSLISIVTRSYSIDKRSDWTFVLLEVAEGGFKKKERRAFVKLWSLLGGWGGG